MALRLLRYEGDPILKKKSKEISKIDNRIVSLAQDMTETLLQEEGVGLSAPQVGILKRLIVVYFDPDLKMDEDEEDEPIIEDYEVFRDGPIVALNPRIIEEEGEIEAYEGCLSFPNKSGIVKRPKTVKVSYTDLEGKEHTNEYSGMIARCFCHEIDHLNGIVYVDRAEPGSIISE